MSNFYSKKVMERFRKPVNFGRMKKPDGIGKVGNIICGDVMWLYIKVGKNKKGVDMIKAISFETFGCVAAVATSSAITEMVKGKTLEKALKIDKKSVINSLDGLPSIKIHCSVLAVDALAEAIYDYFSKNKKEIPKDLELKHQRIQKGLEIIEKRYEKYSDLKEKIIEND